MAPNYCPTGDLLTNKEKMHFTSEESWGCHHLNSVIKLGITSSGATCLTVLLLSFTVK